MRWAKIRKMDVSNGTGIGVSLFLQGCSNRCEHCFNKETWDFEGGKEWTDEIEQQFLQLVLNPHVSRVSFLGGEPMDQAYPLFLLEQKVRAVRPDIKIWIYSGYTFEEIHQSREKTKALLCADILVDGRFIEGQKDHNLLFRGSKNQRIIAVQESLKTGGPVIAME